MRRKAEILPEKLLTSLRTTAIANQNLKPYQNPLFHYDVRNSQQDLPQKNNWQPIQLSTQVSLLL